MKGRDKCVNVSFTLHISKSLAFLLVMTRAFIANNNVIVVNIFFW